MKEVKCFAGYGVVWGFGSNQPLTKEAKMTDNGYQSSIITQKGLFWGRYKKMGLVFWGERKDNSQVTWSRTTDGK